MSRINDSQGSRGRTGQPRYARNPVTGMFEPIEDHPKVQQENRERRTDGDISRRPSRSDDRRPAASSSLSRTTDSNSRSARERDTPSRRTAERKPIDFSEMTQSIDELMEPAKLATLERNQRRRKSEDDGTESRRVDRRKMSSPDTSTDVLSSEKEVLARRKALESRSASERSERRRVGRTRPEGRPMDIDETPLDRTESTSKLKVDEPVRSRQRSVDRRERIPDSDPTSMDLEEPKSTRSRRTNEQNTRDSSRQRATSARNRVASPSPADTSSRGTDSVLSPKSERTRERDVPRERSSPLLESPSSDTTGRRRRGERVSETDRRGSGREKSRRTTDDRSPLASAPLTSPTSDHDNDTDVEMNEKERLEMEKSREEMMQKKMEKRVADEEEAKMVEAARRQRMAEEQRRRHEGSRGGKQYTLASRGQPDSSCLVVDYVEALIRNLEKDPTPTPIPDDFPSPEDYQQWRSSMRRSLQSCLAKMLKYRFIRAPAPSKEKEEPISLRFRVIEAKGLLSKDGKPRSTYCNIEYGDLMSKSKNRDIFRTETVENTLDPVWNQNMTIETRTTTDKIRLEVMDRNREHFLGEVIIPFQELISGCSRDGRCEKWYTLQPRDRKDRYAGGRILIGAINKDFDKPKNAAASSYQDIQNSLNSFNLDNRALYRLLARTCLVLDLYTPREGRKEALSYEAVNMLRVWAATWNISEEYLIIGFVEVLFEKFKEDMVPISDLKSEMELMYSVVKNSTRAHPYEIEICLKLMDEMRVSVSDKVAKYKELFLMNKPTNALTDTIFLLRLIFRFPGYREQHPELPPSFRDELKIILTNSSIERFQRFKESCAPLDPEDAGQVVEGIHQLSELVIEEIEQDIEYFRDPFSSEIDVVRLNAESQLKYFSSVLDDGADVLSSDKAIEAASESMFALYRNVKDISERYAKTVPGLTSLSISYIEDWFAPFIFTWLKLLTNKTMKWVQEAVTSDNFEPIAPTRDGDIPLHSSSITDVFAAMYSELDIISGLNWSNQQQISEFYQAFGKTMNAAIENYCDVLATLEKKSSSSTVAAFTNLLGNKKNEPKDVESDTCAKLRNIAFAQSKLKEMYQQLDVPKIMKALNTKQRKKEDNPELLTGAFMVNVGHGENIKSTLKNGSSNPYVYIRVPEGTVVPPGEHQKVRRKGNSDEPATPPKPTILNGSACEILRSRYVNESLNPLWDETFTVSLPPIEKLEVTVYSKNLLTFDDICGTATIDLSASTKLRRKLQDNQTHDVYVDLEPQGRILLRFTLEGEQEDISFWFRKTNEKLIRTRNSFLRSLTGNITAYVKQVLQKAVKENEAAVLPASTFFQQLTSSTQYSDKTVSGHSINAKVTDSEVNQLLYPLIDYLEKNLETLCNQLPQGMSQAVIERVWSDMLSITTTIMIPHLYGPYSHKLLVPRQIFILDSSIQELREFFHGDGGEFGLPLSILDTQVYRDTLELIDLYHEPMAKLRREYELSFLGGRDKELILRLVRLRVVKDSDEMKWLENALIKRREQPKK